MTSSGENLFFIDTGHKDAPIDENATKVAWVDDEEDDVRVNLNAGNKLKSLKKDTDEVMISGKELSERLRDRHDLLNEKPKWVLSAKESENSVESILNSPFSLVSESSQRHLLPDAIEISRLQNANYQETCKEAIVYCEYHPSTDVVLVANKSSTLRFFTIDDKENPLLHKVDLTGLKPTVVRFSNDGNRVYAIGRSRFVYIYDVLEDRVEKINNIPDCNGRDWRDLVMSPTDTLMALHGEDGQVAMISCSSKRLVTTLKMNGSVRASCFSPDGAFFISAGSDQNIYIWDASTYRCVLKFNDNSGSLITTLSVSPDMNYLVVGSSLGVVNIYQFKSLFDKVDSVSPWKTIMNVTTSISAAVWHPSSELLALTTDQSNNGIRLVHLPSARVFSNWPSSQMSVGLTKAVSFKSDGTELLLGSSDGKVRRFALKHYRN